MARKRPAHEIRLGLIVVRVWRRRARSGSHYSVSALRLYRDGDCWKQSTRFSRDDLPVLRLALDRALTWIFENSQRKQS